MKAIVYTRYGPPDVLQLRDVASPEPKEDQVLVKVRAAAANFLDYRHFKSPSSLDRVMDEAFSKSTNKVLGADIAGNVESIGATVKQFRPGDEVFGVSAGFAGGFAEYTCATEYELALKPTNVSFEAAAAVPVAAITALQGLRDKGHIQPGQKVLINGASGGVGTFAVQIAKSFGAEVTAVCSARKLDMARSIGADHVIDYTQEDLIHSSESYDVIFDVIGKGAYSDILNRLSFKGRYVTAVPQISQILRWQWIVRRNGKRFVFWRPRSVGRYAEDFAFLKDLIVAGSVKAIVDKCFLLQQAAEAHRYVESGHKQGHVVITLT